MYQSSTFPHIINPAVGDAIAALKKSNEFPPPTLPDDGVTWEYFSSILKGDMIGKFQNII